MTKTAADFLTFSKDCGRIYAPEWIAASVKLWFTRCKSLLLLAHPSREQAKHTQGLGFQTALYYISLLSGS